MFGFFTHRAYMQLPRSKSNILAVQIVKRRNCLSTPVFKRSITHGTREGSQVPNFVPTLMYTVTWRTAVKYGTILVNEKGTLFWDRSPMHPGSPCWWLAVSSRGGTSYQKLEWRKISGAKIFAAAPTIPVCPAHLLGHIPFLPSSCGNACRAIMKSEWTHYESYRPTL